MPKTLNEVIERHQKLTLQQAFVDAVITMAEEQFAYYDGLEPMNLVVTDDGRRVPSEVVDEILATIKESVQLPIKDELEKLSKVKIK